MKQVRKIMKKVIVSLTDSDLMSWQDIDSEGDGIGNADLEDEIPRLIDTGTDDDNGNPSENVCSKIYLNGNMWARNSNGTLYIGAKLHTLFYTACNAYTEHVHKQAMEAIKKESIATYEWLFREPVQNWARYTFPPELKCPGNTMNFVESFNGKIEKLRCSKCNQYGHSSRSHREGGVLDIRRGKDQIRKRKETRQKRKVGRLRKDEQTPIATSSTKLSSQKR
ncbi:hypothetical protein Cgig2_012392 [Carnegiea gigantea]|uniref:Uncharacterized protein n=1 Tax=Carnegiea gigantea TaxID=171969 RepID=A0A9Q1GZV9_9CARY|nr:hypothetical protein Cgig2_012392 [Carnegiea gigantea]